MECFLLREREASPSLRWPTRSGTLDFGKNGADIMRAEESANQTLHQPPASPAVLAGAGGGAGELVAPED